MKLNRRVTITTRFSGIIFSLLLLCGLAACSDDNNGSDTPEPEPSTYPTTPFSKIELKEREFEIKLENRQLSVIDKVYVNGGLLLKKAVCCNSRQRVGYKVIE